MRNVTCTSKCTLLDLTVKSSLDFKSIHKFIQGSHASNDELFLKYADREFKYNLTCVMKSRTNKNPIKVFTSRTTSGFISERVCTAASVFVIPA